MRKQLKNTTYSFKFAVLLFIIVNIALVLEFIYNPSDMSLSIYLYYMAEFLLIIWIWYLVNRAVWNW